MLESTGRNELETALRFVARLQLRFILLYFYIFIYWFAAPLWRSRTALFMCFAYLFICGRGRLLMQPLRFMFIHFIDYLLICDAVAPGSLSGICPHCPMASPSLLAHGWVMSELAHVWACRRIVATYLSGHGTTVERKQEKLFDYKGRFLVKNFVGKFLDDFTGIAGCWYPSAAVVI